MASGFMKRTRAAPSWAASWIVAAILLILHGTAPSALQFQPTFELRGAAPAVSADVLQAQRGTLPRVQSRATAVDAGLPKAPQRRWTTGGTPHALPPSTPAVAIANTATVAPNPNRVARPTITTRVFDPRGPPLLTV